MANTSYCAQCGPGTKPEGVLYWREASDKPWERFGAFCKNHLESIGAEIRESGQETKIESLLPAKIEIKS